MRIFCSGPVLLLIITSSWTFKFPDLFSDIIEQSRDGNYVLEEKHDQHKRIKPCPESDAFCEDIDDYPTTYNITDEVLSAKLVKDKIFETLDAGRFDDSLIAESRACNSRKSIVYPKKARNVRGDYMFIVNDAQYRQAVDIEQCLGEGESCQMDSDAPTFGSTVCRQKYATYKMYVINDGGEQFYDSFSLPSACLCHHKTNFVIRNQFKHKPSIDLPICPPPEKLAIPDPSSNKSVATVNKLRKKVKKTIAVRFQERRRRQIRFLSETGHCNTKNETNYCETDEEYPNNLIVRAIENTSELSVELFRQLYHSECKEQVQARGFSIDEEQLCYSVPRIIFPKKAKNLDDQWRYVVNIDNYTQSVEIEECDQAYEDYEDDDPAHVGPDFGSCLYSGSAGNNPDLTICKQIYTEHKLLALGDEGQLVVDRFKLPSACACFFRKDYLLEFRLGLLGHNTNIEDNTEVIDMSMEV